MDPTHGNFSADAFAKTHRF